MRAWLRAGYARSFGGKSAICFGVRAGQKPGIARWDHHHRQAGSANELRILNITTRFPIGVRHA